MPGGPVLPGLFVVFWLMLAALASGGVAAAEPSPAPVEDAQTASLDPAKTTAGGQVKVTGGGWTPSSLVQIAVCGENALNGSSSCAQQNTVSVTVGAQGTISATLPVVLPPKPCPCVVRIVTVYGGRPLDRNVPLVIDGAPYAPLPERPLVPGRLVFIDSGLAGDDSVFTWFGSPVRRRFEIQVGNMGQAPIVNPTFRIGTYEGVYAPHWEDMRWQGTIQPGQRATIRLPIELAPRQHGDFSFRVTYGDQVVDEQALRVGRPWGVYLFGALVVVVVPLTVWRLGSRLVEAVREVRAQKTAERSREVGLPAADGSAPATTGDATTGGTPDDGRAAAVARARPLRLAPAARTREPVTVGGGTPVRSVAETLVVSGPLFSGSAETAATVAADRERKNVPPARDAERTAVPAARPATTSAEPVSSGAEDATRVLPPAEPAEPGAPAAPAEPGAPAAPVTPVTVEDLTKGLAWAPARRDEEGEPA